MIYLDFNRIVCLFSWIGRVIKNRGKARADMAPGCAEWFDPEMAGWIWNYNKLNRNKNYMLLSRAEQARVIVLKNRRQVRLFLKSLK